LSQEIGVKPEPKMGGGKLRPISIPDLGDRSQWLRFRVAWWCSRTKRQNRTEACGFYFSSFYICCCEHTL